MSREKGDSGPLLEFVGRVLLPTGLEKKRATGGDAAGEK